MAVSNLPPAVAALVEAAKAMDKYIDRAAGPLGGKPAFEILTTDEAYTVRGGLAQAITAVTEMEPVGIVIGGEARNEGHNLIVRSEALAVIGMPLFAGRAKDESDPV